MLTDFEAHYLRSIETGNLMNWGAAVGAAAEFARENGLVTATGLSDKGHSELRKFELQLIHDASRALERLVKHGLFDKRHKPTERGRRVLDGLE